MIKMLLIRLGSKFLFDLIMITLRELAKRSDNTIDDEAVEAIGSIVAKHLPK